jgi:hypothetical protein
MTEGTETDAAGPVPEGMKRCSNCGAVKDVEDFGKNQRAKDGRTSACSACNADRCAVYQSRVYAEALQVYGDTLCDCCGTTRAVVLMLVSTGQDKTANLPGGGFPKAFQLRKQGWPPGWRVMCANCKLAETRTGKCDCNEAAAA